MPHHIPLALQNRIPVLYHHHHFSIKEICKILGLCKSTAYTALWHHRKAYRYELGWCCILSTSNVSFIRSLFHTQPVLYLDEIQDHLLQKRNVSVSFSTLVCTMSRIHYSNKKVAACASEQNKLRHAAFMNCIADMVTDLNMLMFIDETSKDQCTMVWRKGWSKVGVHCVDSQNFVCGQCYSILPILTLEGLITYDIIAGSITSEWFLQFLQDFVVSFISIDCTMLTVL